MYRCAFHIKHESFLTKRRFSLRILRTFAMFSSASLLSTLFLALLVAGNPIVVNDNLIRLPITKRINNSTAKDVLRIDQARAKALHARGLARANARLGIKTPPTAAATAASFAVTNEYV